MATYMLTTTDNPYDPRTQWDEWYLWDERSGYHTCGLLARFALRTDGLSDADADLEDDDAIERILDLNPTGNYVKLPIKEKIDPINR